MNFEWDENKNARNIKKHKISFQSAVWVFQDPYRKEYYDEKHSIDEERWATVGMAKDILYVVYTERDEGNTIRLISARPATKREREDYYGDC